MSVSYYANTYLGFRVAKRDFITVEINSKVSCAHPEAQGNKFCPVCGTAMPARTLYTKTEVWKPHILEMLTQQGVEWAEEDGNIQDWNEVIDGILKGAGIHHLRPNCENKGFYVLGVEAHSVSGYRDWVAAMGFEALQKHAAEMIQLQAAFQLQDLPLELFTNLYCS